MPEQGNRTVELTISANYPSPVQVNGFACKNCTDVDYAKKHIDPQHPQSGPYDVNAASDPSRIGEAVKFGGRLAAMNVAALSPNVPVNSIVKTSGAILDVRA